MRDRPVVSAPTDDPVYALRVALDTGFCGNRSSDLPLDHEYPPCVCILPTGHEGMHADGKCRWLLAERTDV